jgi:hypothetical protein
MTRRTYISFRPPFPNVSSATACLRTHSPVDCYIDTQQALSISIHHAMHSITLVTIVSALANVAVAANSTCKVDSKVTITFYGWPDNDPPGPAIASSINCRAKLTSSPAPSSPSSSTGSGNGNGNGGGMGPHHAVNATTHSGSHKSSNSTKPKNTATSIFDSVLDSLTLSTGRDSRDDYPYGDGKPHRFCLNRDDCEAPSYNHPWNDGRPHHRGDRDGNRDGNRDYDYDYNYQLLRRTEEAAAPGAAGVGTYEDPLTMATAWGWYPECTVLYVPYLKKYVVVEDTCAECQEDYDTGAPKHIDIWIGGTAGDNDNAVIQCENEMTPPLASQSIIVNPPNNLPVDSKFPFR